MSGGEFGLNEADFVDPKSGRKETAMKVIKNEGKKDEEKRSIRFLSLIFQVYIFLSKRTNTYNN